MLKQSTKVDVGVVGAWVARSGRRRDDLGRPRRRPVPAGARDELRELRRLRAGPRPSASGSTSRRRTTAPRPASTSTASRPPRPRTPGNVGDANSWRIGAYGAPATGFFDGPVDNVRIYDRALSASEIETDAASRIQPDSTAPSVTQFSPAPGATGREHRQLHDGDVRRAHAGVDDHDDHRPAHRHDEQLERRRHRHVRRGDADRKADAAGCPPVRRGPTCFTVKGGAGGVKDLAGTPLASDATSTFTTEASPQPVLVLSSSSNRVRARTWPRSCGTRA